MDFKIDEDIKFDLKFNDNVFLVDDILIYELETEI